MVDWTELDWTGGGGLGWTGLGQTEGQTDRRTDGQTDMVTDEDAGTIFFIETQKRNMQTLPFPPLDERSASIDFPHGYSRFHSKHCKNNGKQSMAPQTFKSLREINKFVGVDGASRKEGSACFVFLSADTVGVDWTALDWKEAATLEIDSEPGAAQLRGRRT